MTRNVRGRILIGFDPGTPVAQSTLERREANRSRDRRQLLLPRQPVEHAVLIAMKKQHKKSLALTRETVRTLGDVTLARVYAGMSTGTSKNDHGNTCCGCQDTGGGGGGHEQQ